ncbi:Hypothetical protein PACV_34 [Pacmanvirus A23]|uniref:Hypothetical protein n=1 Tax=Pacmanvirus A23 TaxID=1932881 RepID=UPI000A096538|nr:Hypothetical protein B9W72_gp034 [Pacmanvirus A23]SIP85751.1 Hypothetical protein PACV_34 [Pacmanvirus A23]
MDNSAKIIEELKAEIASQKQTIDRLTKEVEIITEHAMNTYDALVPIILERDELSEKLEETSNYISRDVANSLSMDIIRQDKEKKDLEGTFAGHMLSGEAPEVRFAIYKVLHNSAITSVEFIEKMTLNAKNIIDECRKYAHEVLLKDYYEALRIRR